MIPFFIYPATAEEMTSLTCPGEEGGAPIILSLTHSLIYLQSDSKSLTESWYKELERSHKVIVYSKCTVIGRIMLDNNRSPIDIQLHRFTDKALAIPI